MFYSNEAKSNLADFKCIRTSMVLAVVILTTLKNSVFCQTNTYHAFPEAGAHWNEEFETYNQPSSAITDFYTLFFSVDTIIGTKKYHKILKSGLVQGVFISNKYVGALRQDSLQKKVFFKPLVQAEKLLYDFDLLVGDTLPAAFNNNGFFYVSSIDSVVVGSTFRKRFLLNNLTIDYALIEGVGSTFGLFNEIQQVFFEPKTSLKLSCFNGDGKAYPQNSACKVFDVGLKEISGSEKLIKIGPNPLSRELKIEFERVFVAATITVFSLEGQKMMEFADRSGTSITLGLEHLADGIYVLQIKDGDRLITHQLVVKSDN